MSISLLKSKEPASLELFEEQKGLLRINHSDMQQAKEANVDKLNMGNDENGTLDLIKDLF